MKDDTISRQAVLDLLIRCAVPENEGNLLYQSIKQLSSAHSETCEYWDGESNYCALYRPSAQPEPLTDSEQRIFLAAMGREEKVCKEVDELWRDSREPYEDSLVGVCREIERKVKKALWTN